MLKHCSYIIIGFMHIDKLKIITKISMNTTIYNNLAHRPTSDNSVIY